MSAVPRREGRPFEVGDIVWWKPSKGLMYNKPFYLAQVMRVRGEDWVAISLLDYEPEAARGAFLRELSYEHPDDGAQAEAASD